MNEEQSIIWRRLDMPGHESARVYSDGDGWYLDGAAVFLYERQPCRLEYLVQCDPDWQTAYVSVDGWVGSELIELEIEVNQGDVWSLNNEEIAVAEGCIDIDLNFSPITNLLPLRRLNLAVGESKKVRAAWLRFPSFKLEALDQVYTCIDETTVRYESGGGRFVAELKVNEAGLVTNYPDYWTIESEPPA
ncbi:MAG: hypothetical protein HOP17_14170 [Acidobacteria bacterium]|nr:hypothetical protein [Acidobacteriota bacterium]